MGWFRGMRQWAWRKGYRTGFAEGYDTRPPETGMMASQEDWNALPELAGHLPPGKVLMLMSRPEVVRLFIKKCAEINEGRRRDMKLVYRIGQQFAVQFGADTPLEHAVERLLESRRG